MQRDRPSWRRRLALLVAIAALPALSSAASIVDRDGLEFASTEALCSLHCKPWRRNRPDSQCDQQTCPQFFSSRRLDDDSQGEVHADAANVSAKLSVLSCGEADDSLRFSIDADASSISSIFRGFHDAFFGAFDAMITSQNASVQACQLQWLQEDVLPVANATNATASPTVPQPMLVRLDPNADQRACVTHVKSIWTSKDESLTPFLSRADRSTGRSTVMLLHVDAATATRLAGLQCVAQVVELPAILKLLPFARSAFQLSNRQLDKAPALWVRVLKGSDPKTVYARLQSRLTAMDGVTNVFELPERPELFPRGIFVKSMAHLDLWSHAVALAVAETEVEWVDAKSELQFHTLKGYSRVQTQSRRLDDYVESLVGVEPAQERGIRGDDIIVGITDSGLYIDHDQFDQDSRSMYDRPDTSARKVVYYNAWADSYDQSETIICGHGTHVSGLLAGSSFSGQNPNFGIASNARIAFMDIGTQSRACAGQEGCGVGLATPADASQLLQSQIAVGAKIFSFSWGTPGSDYSVQARDLDDFVYNNPEILIVVAAGNSGEDSANGQGTISSPSGAKNVISVGASLNAAASFSNGLCPNVFNPSYVASFSSAGPTTDGRMKPDVVAPGMTLISSQSLAPGSTTKSSATCSLQGTSQATPVVTGIAVLLYQWLRDGWWKNGVKDTAFGMKKIPAALLKALLVHSGDALPRRMGKLPSTPTSCTGLESLSWSLNYPDVYQGYGKPNMSNIADFAAPGSTPTLYFLPNSTEGSEPSVAHDGEVRISFTVPRGVDLRATIVWTDPAGSIRATTQLQHDLDLSVQIRNTSQVFYPLTADKTTKRDQKNNVEMVQVSYQQLVDALQTEGNNSASLLGPNGEIIVDAIIYGRSVLQASAQAFAFVASSSVIGTTSGAATSPGAGGSISNSDKSFWTPWTIGGVGAGALVLLALIAICVRCCTSSKHRRPPGSRPPHGVTAGGVVSYHPYSTPAAGPRRAGLETCPYCAFACSDPVVMVNHVENMHANGAVGAVNGVPGTGFGLPPTVTAAYPPPYGAYLPPSPVPRSDERCPYCSFVSPDPVILVNHVEHMHGEQRVV